jgi:hypothetical protein
LIRLKLKCVIRGVCLCLLWWPALSQEHPGLPWPADDARMEVARRRAAAEEERRLREKMREFVQAWNDFVHEYTERGTFNIRKARLITQAWRKLEREDTWPKK